uniref:TTF-type domain-containing protein n=1 Tax=Oreochromis niloticus TaxID=8128 RepID=A0A669BDB9_ORENI
KWEMKILVHPSDNPTQPHLSFPKTYQGCSRRSFRPEWYKIHPWLEYSQSRDSCYCFACRHFSLPDAPKSVFTSGVGYRNWKKAMFKDSGFCCHAKSQSHKTAMIAWAENNKMSEKNETLMTAMDDHRQKQVLENQTYIRTIAEILILTATENIAQRGHRESADSNKRDIFLEMLNMVGNHDPVVKRRLEQQAKNALYTSKTIQNEIVSCLAEMVAEEIIREVKDSGQFSVIVDETKDVSKSEQISFIVRYYYNGAIHESFLGFQEADRLDAAGLTSKIIGCLEKHGLDYRQNLVGQGYDGASVMSGSHSGVHARIKEVAKYAFYIHCSATKWLTVQQEMFHGVPRELQRLSDTRWSSRHIACRNIMDRLPAILCVLEEISSENNAQRAVEAKGILVQMDLNFVGCLALFRKVLNDSNMLSEMLQSKTVDLSKAINLVESLKETIVYYPTESFFDDLWTDILETCEKSGISTQHIPKRSIQKARKLHDSLVTSTLGHSYHSPTICESYNDVFFELFRLCKIAVVLPVSSASCERTFSALRIIKNYLRSTMTEERLSNLSILSILSASTT